MAMATEISLSCDSQRNIAQSFDILHVTPFSGFPRSVLKLCPQRYQFYLQCPSVFPSVSTSYLLHIFYHVGAIKDSLCRVRPSTSTVVSALYILYQLRDFLQTWLQCSPHQGNVQNPWVTQILTRQSQIRTQPRYCLDKHFVKEEENPKIQYNFFSSDFCRIVSYCGKKAQLCRI